MRALGEGVFNLQPSSPIEKQLSHLNKESREFLMRSFYFKESVMDGEVYYSLNFRSLASSCHQDLKKAAGILYTQIVDMPAIKVSYSLSHLFYPSIISVNSMEQGRFLFKIENQKIVDFTIRDSMAFFKAQRSNI